MNRQGIPFFIVLTLFAPAQIAAAQSTGEQTVILEPMSQPERYSGPAKDAETTNEPPPATASESQTPKVLVGVWRGETGTGLGPGTKAVVELIVNADKSFKLECVAFEPAHGLNPYPTMDRIRVEGSWTIDEDGDLVLAATISDFVRTCQTGGAVWQGFLPDTESKEVVERLEPLPMEEPIRFGRRAKGTLYEVLVTFKAKGRFSRQIRGVELSRAKLETLSQSIAVPPAEGWKFRRSPEETTRQLVETTERETTPAPGSTERKAICDAARAHLVGKYVAPSVKLPRPVVFKIRRIVVSGDYCSFQAEPIFNDGSKISTKYSERITVMDFDFCLKKSGGRWNVICDLSLSDVPNDAWFAEKWREFPKDFPFALLPESWRRRFAPIRGSTGLASTARASTGSEVERQESFKAGDACELDGILSIEGSGNESWFALTVKTPIPITSEGGDNPMSTKLFQIAGFDESNGKKARNLRGKFVRIKGRLMEAHTRHHRTPFLILAEGLWPR